MALILIFLRTYKCKSNYFYIITLHSFIFNTTNYTILILIIMYPLNIFKVMPNDINLLIKINRYKIDYVYI
jgi:hypothetical protein